MFAKRLLTIFGLNLILGLSAIGLALANSTLTAQAAPGELPQSRMLQATIDVTTTIQAAIDAASPGDTITYTYRVTNTGNVNLTNLAANDTPLGPVPLDQTSLAPGQASSGTLTYTIEAADLPGPFISTIIATATTSLGDEIVATASRSVSLLPADRSDLHLYLPLILESN